MTLSSLKTLLPVLGLLALAGALPATASAKSCSAYSNQAAAQRAADTRDADGDGIYCESLPCPCLKGVSPTPIPTPTPVEQGCSRPSGIRSISFSGTKYPNIRRHFLNAVKDGWPTTLVLLRSGASQRRDRLLRGIATRAGFDRDEYPPAVGRGQGAGLTRGFSPIGWLATVMYVPSSENRSHGSVLGAKLRGLCSGTKFRYVFY
ncbi:MAG: hypothetical protein NTV40_00605 [Solirubrobacterales bacterium]|nr:hypothetical protein [Solirubrobacterales bacterium]